MRAFLKKLIENKKKRAAELEAAVEAATTIEEVRSLGDTLKTVRKELEEAESQLAKLDSDNGNTDDEAGTEVEASRSMTVGMGSFNPNAATLRGSFNMGAPNSARPDIYDTDEYRTAFMNFVCRSTPIPQQYRATTTTTDASAVIPTNIMNEIIQKMESYGNILAKVRRISVQGGVQIPILSLKPTATWISEASTSQDKKIKADEFITFSYFGLECKISQTLLASVTTLAMFQQLFVPLATEAVVKALEISIFNGTGTGQPLGILNDTRIPAENIIEITAAEVASYGGWKSAVFTKIKKAYRKGEFIMNQATFDAQIDGMVDQTGQPIGRVNYGIDGEEKYRFCGKNIETVDDDMLPSYENCAEGAAFAIFGDLKNYIINSNMEMTTEKWKDHDTNEIKNKCMLICDGKLADTYGIYIIKKAKATA